MRTGSSLRERGLRGVGMALLPIFLAACTTDTMDETTLHPGAAQLRAVRSVGHYVRDPAPAAVEVESRSELEFEDRKIEVYRDSYGVPHVFAESDEALFYAQGYLMAEDRLWQMELYRRFARGELSEIEGEAALDIDRTMRRLALSDKELQNNVEQLGEWTRGMYESFAQGVSAFMQSAHEHGCLPDEFRVRGIEPRLWSAADSVAVAAMLFRRVLWAPGAAQQLEHWKLFQMLRTNTGSDEEAMRSLNDLVWFNDPAAPTMISGREPKAVRGGETVPPNLRAVLEMAPEFDTSLAPLARLQEKFKELAPRYKLPHEWASYAWVVGPEHSVSGTAMILGGPEMGFSAPQMTHEIHLSGNGFEVVGGTAVGLPGILVGHNGHLAWSLTYAHAHLDDLFVEKLSLDDRYSYSSRGDLRQMEKRTEEIRVKGRSEPVVEEFFRTIHGPVVGWDREHRVALSLGAGFFKHESGTLRCFSGLLRARTIEEAAAVISHMSHSLNYMIATKSGDIAYYLGARLPTYVEGVDTRFPMPGTGECDWIGFRDPESLPHRVNPREGYILSWNNKPVPDFDDPGAARWMWARNHRVIQLQRVFEARRAVTGGKLTLTDLLDMTADVGLMGDGSPTLLLPFLLRAADEAGESLDPQQRQAVAYLRAWDHRFTDWNVAFTLYSAWVDELEKLLFPPPTESAEEQLLWRKVVTPTTLLHALEGTESSVPLSRDYLAGRPRSEVCLQALAGALEKVRSVHVQAAQKTSTFQGPAHGSQEGSRGFATDQMNFWFTRQARLNIDPLPPVPYSRRGSYLFGAEMTPEVLTYSVVLPGESGDPKSPHFADQRDLAGWYMFKMVASSRQQLLGRPLE